MLYFLVNIKFDFDFDNREGMQKEAGKHAGTLLK